MEPKSTARERKLLETLNAAARFCDQRIGWNRIGFLLSVAIIAIAAVVLYRILRNIDVQEVIDSLKASNPRNIALAALFVAAGYFTLTFYDLFALRTIGRTDVPYRVAALAGFTSYSVGHNIGASVFTGGAVRYRVYSAWGLSAIDVAKICFVAGLTFWLGNATVLGLGIAYQPLAATAIDQLPAWLNRAGAIADPGGADALRHLGVVAPARRRAATVGASPCRAARSPCCRSASASSTSDSARWRCTCWCRTSPIPAS